MTHEAGSLLISDHIDRKVLSCHSPLSLDGAGLLWLPPWYTTSAPAPARALLRHEAFVFLSVTQ